jgi:hypothetical protein
VPLSAFISLLDERAWDRSEVLFVRSHLGRASNAGHVADSGVEFADGILSARLMSTRMDSGAPLVPMPPRVVLALCSGSGAADAVGLNLGLAAACRVAGAEEVLTSNFNVLDTQWSCDLDHRLARCATTPAPLAASLRELQLECLAEWRSASLTGFGSPEIGPLPVIWACYGVVI